MAKKSKGYSPFKMKGAPTIAGSPLHKDERKWYRKVWDEATQIGMGAKAFLDAAEVEVGSRTTLPFERSVKAAKRAYKKEEAADLAAAERKSQMKKKKSPAKHILTWGLNEAWVDKDQHNKKHARGEMDMDHNPISKDKKKQVKEKKSPKKQ